MLKSGKLIASQSLIFSGVKRIIITFFPLQAGDKGLGVFSLGWKHVHNEFWTRK